MGEQKWPWARKLYLALAIMLTIQIIPLVGASLNNIFLYAVVGVALSITVLIRAPRDNCSSIGAGLGLITFLMAIISGILTHTWLSQNIFSIYNIIDYLTKLIVGGLWMSANWGVGISATIVCYMNTFMKQSSLEPSATSDNGNMAVTNNETVITIENYTHTMAEDYIMPQSVQQEQRTAKIIPPLTLASMSVEPDEEPVIDNLTKNSVATDNPIPQLIFQKRDKSFEQD